LLKRAASTVREAVGDRALLRAKHFYADNERVLKQARALNSGDFEQFKKLIIESGRFLIHVQSKCIHFKNPREQQVAHRALSE
jgi:galactokinase